MKVNQHIYKLLKQEAKKKNTYNIQKEINVRSFVNIKPFRKTIYSNLQREKILRNYCTKKRKEFNTVILSTVSYKTNKTKYIPL